MNEESKMNKQTKVKIKNLFCSEDDANKRLAYLLLRQYELRDVANFMKKPKNLGNLSVAERVFLMNSMCRLEFPIGCNFFYAGIWRRYMAKASKHPNLKMDLFAVIQSDFPLPVDRVLCERFSIAIEDGAESFEAQSIFASPRRYLLT